MLKIIPVGTFYMLQTSLQGKSIYSTQKILGASGGKTGEIKKAVFNIATEIKNVQLR